MRTARSFFRDILVRYEATLRDVHHKLHVLHEHLVSCTAEPQDEDQGPDVTAILRDICSGVLKIAGRLSHIDKDLRALRAPLHPSARSLGGT